MIFVAKIKNVDIVNGNILRSIIRYSIPMILIALIQNLFNAVDMIVLGQVADSTAVASVGATSVILSLLVNMLMGIGVGAKVVLARLLGAGDEERVKKTVSTIMITALLIGAFSATVGTLLAKPLLMWTGCPADCRDGALIYLRIYILSAPAIMVYNFGKGVITVSGDAQRPLYYMIISGILNVILNFVLCMILPQKVIAVAVATASSQILGAILILNRLAHIEGMCHFSFRRLSFSSNLFGKILSNGLPIAFSSALYPMANLQIQAATNSFGSSVLAGGAAASNIEGLVGTVGGSGFAACATAFVGQNLGAEKPERVKKSILYCFGLGVGIAFILSVTIYTFSAPLASLYVGSDQLAIAAAQTRMKYVLLPLAINVAFSVINNTNQAFGYASFTAIVNFTGVLGFRVLWMTFIYPLYPTYVCICQCYLVSWLLTFVISSSFLLYIYFGRFKKGKLKKM